VDPGHPCPALLCYFPILMDNESVQEIVDECAPLLTGRAPGKIFQFNSSSLAIDFGLRSEGYLFLSVEPANPRLYLIKRRVRDLEKLSRPLTQFPLTLRKELSGVRLNSLTKDPQDRIVRFAFTGTDEIGDARDRSLIAQLTGRSANLLLLDANEQIIQTLRTSEIPGQQVGERYHGPENTGQRGSRKATSLLDQIRKHNTSPSEAADSYFISLFVERAAAARLVAARADLRKRTSQKQNLLKQLELDLQSHAGAEEHKHIGDLLLANVTTARRNGNRVTLIDYFSDNADPIEIEIDESASLQEEAQRRFAMYSRSKRALAQITSRIAQVTTELRKLEFERQRLELMPADTSESFGSAPTSPSEIYPGRASSAETAKPTKRIPGTRRYVSVDGFEILVGRTSKDNDHLTFKVARPNDTWLHAADYGGSHVVVRNSTRKEIPHRTLIEAAQLAAYFSQAKKDPKVDVHYTERKFVSKPKGAKPGLARMQRFKNITVEPKEAGVRE
jgi:predicted ribosome quality control (RQC) complex YloA/Tae2 family protein